MDVEIVRNHYPVGQGFFSSQQILYGDKKFTCVYDCGSVSEKGDCLLVKYMDDLKKTTNTIDLLVLSHFDADHINGVKNLLIKFNIKKIVIPYLNTFEKLLFLLGKSIPLDFHAIQTDFYFLVYLIGDGDDNFLRRSDFLRRIEEEEGIEVVSSRSEVTSVEISLDSDLSTRDDECFSPFWEFSYFSLAPGDAGKVEEDLIKKFKGNLTGELLQGIENNNISLIYENRSCIKCAYRKAVCEVSNNYPRKVPKTDPYNFSSVVLYSGPAQNSRYNIFSVIKKSLSLIYTYSNGISESCCYNNLDFSNLGWLGTGDARLRQKKNIAELDRKLKKCRKKLIGTITIPHHGSFLNWNNGFIELFGKCGSKLHCIAGADPECKRYRRPHPHDSVIGSVVRHSSLFHLVSTEPNSLYKEEINICLSPYYVPLANSKMSLDNNFPF